MTIHNTADAWALAYADSDTALGDYPTITQQVAETVAAALTRGGIAPPGATDLAAEANTRAVADTALGNRATALENGGALPLVTLRQTAAQSCQVGWTSLTWGAEDYDPDDLHSLTTNPTRVTVKRKGLYQLSASVPLNPAASTRCALRWVRNGITSPLAPGATAWAPNVAANGDTLHAPRLSWTLLVGDYIELQVGNAGSAAVPTGNGGSDSLAAVLTLECKRILP